MGRNRKYDDWEEYEGILKEFINNFRSHYYPSMRINSTWYRPFIKFHGGKFYQLTDIINKMPPHNTFVETCGGGGGVVLNKQKTKKDVYNDISPMLVNMFNHLKHVPEFLDEIRKLTYSKETFFYYKKLVCKNPMENALRELVRRKMSIRGKARSFCWQDRTRRGMPGEISAWLSFLTLLDFYREQFQKISIENLDIIDCILKYDSPTTLFYIDPPYNESKISVNEKQMYDNYMPDSKHEALARLLDNIKGQFLLSGFQDTKIEKWYKKFIRMPINKNNYYPKKIVSKKFECLWANYSPFGYADFSFL